MRTLITGATGLMGMALCSKLAAQGGQQVVLSRSPEAALERVPGAVAAFASPSAGQLLPTEAFEAVEAVVHLAGEPVNGRWTKAKKRSILASRVEGTRALVESIAALPEDARPSVLVSASAIGFYGERGDDQLAEDSSNGSGFLAEVCQAWEAEALRAEALGLRVVLLRTGIVMAEDGGAFAEILPTARWGLAGPIGGGRQWWAWIHIEDALRLIEWVLSDADVSGPVNLTSPSPVTQREFARVLARALGRPAFLPTPAWVLRLVLGGFSAEILTSKRVLPARALEAGFEFHFGGLPEAIEDLLAK